MSLQEISFHTEKLEKIYIINIQGSIDAFTKLKFLETIDSINQKGPLIVDLEGVNTVSSIGIQAFKELAEISYNNGHKIVLLNLNQSVRQVFNMGGIKYLFQIAENEDEAVKIVSRGIK